MRKVIQKSKRTSLYMLDTHSKAMQVVKREKNISKTAQLQMAMKRYFEEHKELLLSKGIDLWKD